MSRIADTLNRLQTTRRRALIPYIVAGDPHPSHTVSLMHALVRGGADIIELGVPFSDPMADGPVIQLACERALAHNTGLSDIFDMVRRFRADDSQTPVVLMGYLNPIEMRGIQRFADEAHEAGVDGVLAVDLAVEEAPEVTPIFRDAGLDSIFLIAPTSTPARIASVSTLGSGYVYYVSLKGVTGSGRLDPAEVAEKVAQIRKYVDLPVAVGFGVRDDASARAVGANADAVVVGSALVSKMEALQERPQEIAGVLEASLRELRAALDTLG
jgi:tryptophan synthase alpha chain